MHGTAEGPAGHGHPAVDRLTGDAGGMNVFVSALASNLSAHGIDVHVFTRSAGPDLPPTVTLDDGVRVHHIDAGPATLRKEDLASHLCAFHLAVAAHPAMGSVQLLHGHYWMSGWVGRKLKQRRGLPLVQRFHTLARADGVHIVPPGVDTDLFRPDGERTVGRRDLGGGRLLLFVGRLQPMKGPDTAVRTLAALDAHLPDDGLPTRLLIVGGASGNRHGTTDPDALRRLARQLGVSDRVALLAPRPHAELAPLYRAADALLMPSRSESFGLVALEAQACGTPVVAADVGGPGDVVGSGGGTLVDAHGPEAYARAVAPYLLDRRVRATASARAVRGAQRFTWHRTVQQTLEVYASVLGATRQVGGGRRGA